MAGAINFGRKSGRNFGQILAGGQAGKMINFHSGAFPGIEMTRRASLGYQPSSKSNTDAGA